MRPLFLFLLLVGLAPAASAHASGYPRPKGASPINVSLVAGFRPCTTPNRTHGAPLAYPSCTPPARSSDTLGIGPNPQFLCCQPARATWVTDADLASATR